MSKSKVRIEQIKLTKYLSNLVLRMLNKIEGNWFTNKHKTRTLQSVYNSLQGHSFM